jgi:hypothetical protein
MPWGAQPTGDVTVVDAKTGEVITLSAALAGQSLLSVGADVVVFEGEEGMAAYRMTDLDTPLWSFGPETYCEYNVLARTPWVVAQAGWLDPETGEPVFGSACAPDDRFMVAPVGAWDQMRADDWQVYRSQLGEESGDGIKTALTLWNPETNTAEWAAPVDTRILPDTDIVSSGDYFVFDTPTGLEIRSSKDGSLVVHSLTYDPNFPYLDEMVQIGNSLVIITTDGTDYYGLLFNMDTGNTVHQVELWDFAFGDDYWYTLQGSENDSEMTMSAWDLSASPPEQVWTETTPAGALSRSGNDIVLGVLYTDESVGVQFLNR